LMKTLDIDEDSPEGTQRATFRFAVPTEPRQAVVRLPSQGQPVATRT
jgi:hypothetical protein